MKYEPLFDWNEEARTATCLLTDYQSRHYFGMATCHEDDTDMMSEKTGKEIAFKRAKIQALRGYRDELKQQLKSLKELYYSMNQSTKFNPSSYEAKMLNRKIKTIELDISTAKELIRSEQQELLEYIKGKDAFYNKVRSNRKKVNNN